MSYETVNTDISDEKLNLFIDKQLDTEEMNAIHEAMLDNSELRERACQLKAVRELVGYAYSEVPSNRYADNAGGGSGSVFSKALAASITLFIGVMLGWNTYEYSPNAGSAISAENTFQFVANQVTVDHKERKIVLHIDTGDLQVVNKALNEADHLLATYREANIPLKLDIVANKAGINVLRPDVSPYISRIRKLVANADVELYACERSIAKAHKKEGRDIVLMPGVITNQAAREIIPERLEKGWVYIKA
ncbi:MAG TPA: hypothetical protein ENI98_01800 [Gammaproteobacteria bacterium]|nr:hypothetical protein [Gammaproteobacteria bacterium]